MAWQSCDELRGGMDASQYKDYVLTLLFMKYVSDKYAADPGALIEVPRDGGFANMVQLKADKEIGDKINKIIGRLAEAKMDLIPPGLIVARWFAAEQATIERLQADRETAARELEEFVEEHASADAGQDGPLAEVTNVHGRVVAAAVKARLKAIRGEAESEEEQNILKRCLILIEAESKAGKAVNEAQAALDRAVLARYAVLTVAEIRTLLVEDKWFASIRTAIDGDLKRLTPRLAGASGSWKSATCGPFRRWNTTCMNSASSRDTALGGYCVQMKPAAPP